MIEEIKGVELQSLICPKCSARLMGTAESTFVYCSNCVTGFEISTKGEYSPVSVYFARTSDRSSQFKPFWAFDAKLELKERERKKSWKTIFSSSRGLATLFQERQILRFYVPAYFDDLLADEPAGLKLTLDQPQLESLNPMREVPAVAVTSKDAEKIADYIFLTSEMNLPDVVQSLEYRLELSNPFLFVIGL
jgi:hypothetical protein